MRRRSHAELADALRALRAPDEASAEQRAWPVVRAVYAERVPVVRRRVRVRAVLAAVVALAAGVLALTPAGAAVHRWIEQTLGVRHASPALFALPAPGELLVAGSGGAWTVAADGSRHRLGSWRDASFSPHGLYIAVAGHDQLAAVDPHGTQAWAIARPDVSSPRWFSPSGYRVAYLSGGSLRVIAGDGVGDHQLIADVRRVAPAWRDGYPYQLAYVTATGAVALRDADTGRLLWSRSVGARPQALHWSTDGARLLVLGQDGATVLDGRGRVLARIPASGGARPLDAALSPDGKTAALLTATELTLTVLAPARVATHEAFSGQGLRQVVFSPDGRWLLVSWPAADQWIFVRAGGSPRIAAVSRIAEQFGGRRSLPALDGWCCTAPGGPS